MPKRKTTHGADSAPVTTGPTCKTLSDCPWQKLKLLVIDILRAPFQVVGSHENGRNESTPRSMGGKITQLLSGSITTANAFLSVKDVANVRSVCRELQLVPYMTIECTKEFLCCTTTRSEVPIQRNLDLRRSSFHQAIVVRGDKRRKLSERYASVGRVCKIFNWSMEGTHTKDAIKNVFKAVPKATCITLKGHAHQIGLALECIVKKSIIEELRLHITTTGICLEAGDVVAYDRTAMGEMIRKYFPNVGIVSITPT